MSDMIHHYQRKRAYNKIERNEALMTLALKAMNSQDIMKGRRLKDELNFLPDDGVKEFMLNLDSEAKDLFLEARQGYDDRKKDIRAEKNSVRLQHGMLSHQYFTMYVKRKVLSNMANRAGVAGIRYQYSKWRYGNQASK